MFQRSEQLLVLCGFRTVQSPEQEVSVYPKKIVPSFNSLQHRLYVCIYLKRISVKERSFLFYPKMCVTKTQLHFKVRLLFKFGTICWTLTVWQRFFEKFEMILVMSRLKNRFQYLMEFPVLYLAESLSDI